MARFVRALSTAKDAWLILGVTVLLFVVVEAGLTAALAIRQRVRHSVAGGLDPRASADAYPDSMWVGEYYQEHHRSSEVGWRPYVYWRRHGFQGRHINVGADGVRTSLRPFDQPARGTALRVFMFGGSTLWGTGARDQFTIPSVLAQELRGRGIDAEITNFGETGYVSTQGLIQLMLLLRAGTVPDIVIFYDGVNDTFSAIQQRTPGLPQNEFNRAREFNLTQKSVGTLAQAALSRLATVRILVELQRRAGLVPRRGRAGLDEARLAAETASAYAGNVRVVKALAGSYGFEPLFYWQPTIFNKPRRTGYEDAERVRNRSIEGFFGRTYRAIANTLGQEGRFHDISRIFAETSEPIFIDWSHLGEHGNLRVALRMAEDVAVIAAGTTPERTAPPKE